MIIIKGLFIYTAGLTMLHNVRGVSESFVEVNAGIGSTFQFLL